MISEELCYTLGLGFVIGLDLYFWMRGDNKTLFSKVFKLAFNNSHRGTKKKKLFFVQTVQSSERSLEPFVPSVCLCWISVQQVMAIVAIYCCFYENWKSFQSDDSKQI